MSLSPGVQAQMPIAAAQGTTIADIPNRIPNPGKVFAPTIPLTQTHIASPDPTSHESAELLLQQGQTQYDRGALPDAQDRWQQALRVATTPDLQIASLNALAIVAQDLGQWTIAADRLAQAQALLDSSFQHPGNPSGKPHPTPAESGDRAFLQAQLWNTAGTLAFRQGNVHLALDRWEQSGQLYHRISDRQGEILSQLNQIYALQALGFYGRTGTLIQTLQTTIATLPGDIFSVKVWRSLGNVLQGLGRIQEAQQALEVGLNLAQTLNLRPLMAEIILEQGNVYALDMIDQDPETEAFRQTGEKALSAFKQISTLEANPLTVLQGEVNTLRLLVRLNRPMQTHEFWPTLRSRLAGLPPSRTSVFARINVAESLMRAWQKPIIRVPFAPTQWPDRPAVMELLQEAVTQAHVLGDPRLESFAVGQLGHLYEVQGDSARALELTDEALRLADRVQARDTIALWQWQKGRLLKTQGQREAAIGAYRVAVQTLQTLRQDLVTNTADVQFSFRDSVEPVYRELTDLLLQTADRLAPTEQQARLREARKAIEDLQLAELDNFFREACLDGQPQDIDALDPHAAVIYPILLQNSIEVIVSLPNGSLIHHRVEVSNGDRDTALNRLRQYTNPVFTRDRLLAPSTEVYNWLLRPLESTLAQQQIQTLVFVLDGSLRSIPMSLLYDGQRFLLEKYNLAIAPGLRLLRPAVPMDSDRRFNTRSILLGGLSQAHNGFESLPNVQREVEGVAALIPSHTVLLNDDFTEHRVVQELKEDPTAIVHFATHGQFSSRADQTFLLTWQGEMNVKTLDQLLQERFTQDPIDLLVLSACQTAQGDDRAALGLAGMAVRSGARSTLGTLWAINDRSTAQLILDFYHNLAQGQTKAQALRQAQLALLHSADYDHPYYWAPFVLIGQWR